MVRHKQGRVDKPADSVVDELGRRERLVAAFVSASLAGVCDRSYDAAKPDRSRTSGTKGQNVPNDPETGAEESGPDGVGGVERDARGLVRNGRERAAHQLIVLPLTPPRVRQSSFG